LDGEADDPCYTEKLKRARHFWTKLTVLDERAEELGLEGSEGLDGLFSVDPEFEDPGLEFDPEDVEPEDAPPVDEPPLLPEELDPVDVEPVEGDPEDAPCVV
jgi:hypothetical protein